MFFADSPFWCRFFGWGGPQQKPPMWTPLARSLNLRPTWRTRSESFGRICAVVRMLHEGFPLEALARSTPAPCHVGFAGWQGIGCGNGISHRPTSSTRNSTRSEESREFGGCHAYSPSERRVLLCPRRGRREKTPARHLTGRVFCIAPQILLKTLWFPLKTGNRGVPSKKAP